MPDEVPLFALRNARIEGPSGPILRDVSMTIRDRAVTALMGPAGVGKSTLLRALGGARLPEAFSIGGTWSYRGCRVDLPPAMPSSEIAWVPQRGRLGEPGADLRCRVFESIDDAIAFGTRTILLDEPTRSKAGPPRGALVAALRAHAADGAAVVVTHDLSFAREVADELVLLCAGRVVASGPAAPMFAAPPTELVARFFAQGNCWPTAEVPVHFRWIEEGRLAGMGRPGLLAPIEDDLAGVAGAGVTMLVSLTEEPLPAAQLRAHGLAARHFPIADMGVPPLGPCASLCREIERAMGAGECVAVHCHAGVGRTGTILAALLAWSGAAPEAAIERLRAIRPAYIQTRGQQEFVHRFAETICGV